MTSAADLQIQVVPLKFRDLADDICLVTSSAHRPTERRATRLKPKHWLAGTALALGLFGAPTTAEFIGAAIAPAAADEATDESRYVERINDLRVASGLEPVTVHPELVEQARDWASQLRANDQLSHASDLSIGVTAEWVKLGENVGVGPDDQLPAIFDAFVASPAHFDNLMDPDFRFVGVGVVYDDEGRMWTAHRFMAVTPSDDVVAAGTTTQAADDEAPSTLAFSDTADVDAQDAASLANQPLAELFEQLASGGY